MNEAGPTSISPEEIGLGGGGTERPTMLSEARSAGGGFAEGVESLELLILGTPQPPRSSTNPIVNHCDRRS
jgi:hypothetical protein